MTDPTLIRELLLEINRNTLLLDELRESERETFLADPHIYLLAERCFQLAIQCLLDICYYIAARKSWSKPKDGAEAIELMGRQGVVPMDFAREIVGMANFRNILVHTYLGINREIVYEYLGKTEDFRVFSRHVETFIDGEQDG
jgi:uncharacterized protein YutE (UPF0331/DUF86 family)